jgi:hypothetical protein
MLAGLPFSLQIFPVSIILNSLYRLNEVERNVSRPLLFSDYPEDGGSKLLWQGSTCNQSPLLHIHEYLTHVYNDVVDRTSLNKQGYDKQTKLIKRRHTISEYIVIKYIREDRRKDIKIN